MRPYFFGPSDRRLFGVYYAPQAPMASRGVVLCYPMGHEYVNALRGCRQLALQLARVGLHVLRFDYSGTGDSAMEAEQTDVSHWMADIDVAIDELRNRHGLASVSLVGLRLGGTLATLVASNRRDVGSLVLWEPVVSGQEYLAELRSRHQAFVTNESQEGRNAARWSGPSEIMGFPLSDAACVALQRIDLRQVARPPARSVLTIGNGEPVRAVVEHLQAVCERVDHRVVPGQRIWIRVVHEPRALVPQPVLEAVVGWLAADAS